MGGFEFVGCESPRSSPAFEGCGLEAMVSSVAGVADPGAARSVKEKRTRWCRRGPRRTYLRTSFWGRFQRAKLDSGWRILAPTVNPFVKYWRARQIR